LSSHPVLVPPPHVRSPAAPLPLPPFPPRRSSDLLLGGPQRLLCRHCGDHLLRYYLKEDKNVRRRSGSLRDGASGLSHADGRKRPDRKSTRLNSSHVSNSYAVFCLKKNRNKGRVSH